MSDEDKRKFTNPTPGFVGAVIINDEGKKEGVPVEPGGSIWLSPAEERATAEAPRSPADNPFVKGWEEPVEWDRNGEVIRSETRQGVLVLSSEPPRPVASDRFVPSRDTAPAAAAEEPPPAPAEEPEEVTGDDGVPKPTGPAPEGKPAPDEHVATPEAVAANDAELAAREAAARDEAPTPVEERPQGTEAIGVRRDPLPV